MSRYQEIQIETWGVIIKTSFSLTRLTSVLSMYQSPPESRTLSLLSLIVDGTRDDHHLAKVFLSKYLLSLYDLDKRQQYHRHRSPCSQKTASVIQLITKTHYSPCSQTYVKFCFLRYQSFPFSPQFLCITLSNQTL